MQQTTKTDLELIAEVKAGHTPAFGVLVNRYQELGYSVACSILKDEQLAEDALQDSFIKAFKNLKGFKGNAKFSTWLLTIVINTCKSHLRKNKGKWLDLENTSVAIEKTADGNSQFQLEDLERQTIVNALIDKLNTDESLLLRLFYLAELSIKEIQKTTGFSESKVKVGLHRARKSFERLYELTLQNEKI